MNAIKLFSAVALLTCALTQEAQAQFEVKVNAAGLIVTQFQGGVEYVATDNWGFGLLGSTVSRETEITVTVDGGEEEVSEWKSNTQSLIPYVRYYFSPDEGGDGFFMEGYYKYRNRTWEDRTLSGEDANGDIMDYQTDIIQNISGIGLGIGQKWVSDNGLFGEYMLGAGRTFNRTVTYTEDAVTRYYDNTGENIDLGLLDLDLRMGVSIGYRF